MKTITIQRIAVYTYLEYLDIEVEDEDVEHYKKMSSRQLQAEFGDEDFDRDNHTEDLEETQDYEITHIGEAD